MIYYRECDICTNPNPAERAVMEECGHITCLACAYEIADLHNDEADCPLCRAHTNFSKIFEVSNEFMIITIDF